MRLRPIAVEEAACRKAWKDKRVGTWAWHLHHETLIEKLNEPAKNRIDYILSDKPEEEQALRLRLFRPVKSKVLAAAWAEYDKLLAPARAEYDKVRAAAWAEYDKVLAAAHKKDCRDCPWDGTSIFGRST